MGARKTDAETPQPSTGLRLVNHVEERGERLFKTGESGSSQGNPQNKLACSWDLTEYELMASEPAWDQSGPSAYVWWLCDLVYLWDS